ncbi:STAS domain-containing protein [Streptomyces gardneri]|uniref:STAS domain-containing protein n=1 Tax=Streptomyces gardneri TaxID=66892 RepID=UPI0035D87BF5
MTHFPEAPGLASLPHGADEGITVSARPTADGTVVTIRGELDIVSAASLRTCLFQAITACADGGGLALDLSQVTFCDSTGLNVLLLARRRALGEHHTMVITAAGPQVTRLLETTGAAPLFTGTTRQLNSGENET